MENNLFFRIAGDWGPPESRFYKLTIPSGHLSPVRSHSKYAEPPYVMPQSYSKAPAGFVEGMNSNLVNHMSYNQSQSEEWKSVSPHLMVCKNTKFKCCENYASEFQRKLIPLAFWKLLSPEWPLSGSIAGITHRYGNKYSDTGIPNYAKEMQQLQEVELVTLQRIYCLMNCVPVS